MEKDTSLKIFVGEFNEIEIKEGVDREQVKAKRILYPHYKYTHTKIVYEGGKPKSMKIWLSRIL